MRLTRPMRAAWAAVLTAAIAVAVLGAGMPAVAAQASGDGAGSGQDAGPDVTEGLEPGTLEGGIEPDPGAGAASLAYPNLGARLSALAVAAASAVGGEGGAGNSSESGSYATAMIGLSITFDGDSEQAVEAITAVGGDVRNVFDGYVEAFVPSTALAALAQIPGLTWARELAVPHKDRGRYTSGGVAAHLADAWHDAGITGGGVKIGVIDASSGVTARDGFTGLRSAMASGDLPATVVGRCYKAVALATSDIDDCAKAGGDSHGMSVAATVMDVAPDASLYISNARTWGDLQRSVEWMKNQGVGVIVHSTSWSFHGAADGTTPVNPSPLRTVKWAADNGIVWVNSGGNRNGKTWFGAFTDADNDNIHEWATGDEYQEFTLNAGESKDAVFMRWDDAWGTASKDLALLVVKNPGTASEQVVDNLNDEQKGASNSFPFEFKSFTAPHAGTYAFVVKKMSGAAPGWIQMATFGSLAHSTTGHSVISPADSPHAGMLAVGAASTASSDIRSYSSLGPTPDGRVKPDIVGADGYVAVSGTNYGTSYATPHVAGLAALVRQQNPEFSAVQTAEYLKTHAAPRGNPYPNNTWGHGFAQLPPLGCVDRLDGDGTVSGAWTSGCTSAVHTQKSSRYYTFTISQQSTVTIDLSSSVDGYLYLRNGYNNQKDVALHTDDNSGTGADARISASLAAGTYTIEATTASTGQTGAFTLAVSGGLTEVSEVGISAGADITEGGNAVFTLTATPAPPSPLTATVEITADGDWGITPRTQTVTIPATGTATLTLATYNDSTEEYDGSVTMRVIGKPAYVVSSTADAATVQVSDDDGATPCTDPITGDGSTSSELTLACKSFTRNAHANFFTFSITQPRVVTIEMNAFDDGYKESTYLYLRQGNGTLRGPALYEDDSSGPGRDSKIVAVLEPGDYTIEATTEWEINFGSNYLTKFTLVVSGLTSQPTEPHIGIFAAGDATEGNNATFNLRAIPAPSANLAVSVSIGQRGEFGFSPSAGSRTVTIPTSGRATLTFATQNDQVVEDVGWVTATLNDQQGYTVSTAGSATVGVTDDDGGPPCSQTLSGDGSLIGVLSAGCESVDAPGHHARFYTFTMVERGTVVIDMDGDMPAHGLLKTADTYLSLRSGDDVRSGATLAEDEGAHEYAGAEIREIIDAGTYTIEARSKKAALTGAFELTVDGIKTATTTPVIPDSACVTDITDDGPYSGEWTSSCLSIERTDFGRSPSYYDNYARYFAFDLQQRSTVTIDLESDLETGPVPYLYLHEGRGVRPGASLHSDYDHGCNPTRGYCYTTPRDGIARVSVPLDAGWYLIEATTQLSSRDGPFTLRINGISPPGTPTASIAAGAGITEGGNATFTVTVDPAPSADVDVTVAVSQAGDFGVTPASHTVTVPISGSATVTFATENDSVGEYDGTVTATVVGGNGYRASTDAGVATVVVSDDDGGAPCSVQLSGNGRVDGKWTSGCTSTDRVSRYSRFYSFYLSHQSAVTIDLRSFEDNYLSLRSGEDTQTGTPLHENDDRRPRPSTDALISETLAVGWYTIEATTRDQAVSDDFTLTVSGLTTQPAGTGPVVSIEAGPDITEGDEATFTVTADPAPSADLEVRVDVTPTGDFFNISFASYSVMVPTSGSATVTVTTKNDSVDETDGSVTATVTAGTGYTVSATAGSASVAVADDDDPPCSVRLSGNGSVASKWTSGCDSTDRANRYARFYSFNLSQESAVTIELASFEDNYLYLRSGEDTQTGAALHYNDDYRIPGTDAGISETLAAGWYTIEATTFDQAVSGDFTLTVSGLTAQPTGPEVSIAAGSGITEGGDAVFTVTADPAPSAALDVTVAITQSGDFGVTPTAQTVSIPTSGAATLTVTTANDSADEADGSVTATIDTGSGYTISSTAGAATVAVADDDDPPCDTADAISRARAAFAWHTDNNGGNEVVFWQVLAYLGADPMPAPPGGAVLASTTPEAVKAFSDGKTWPGWVPINAAMSCHPPPPEVSITAGADIDEGGDAVFTVTADPAPTAALAVTVAVSASGDFGVSPGSHTVTIPTTGSATLTVATAGDSADEADGSVTATVSAGSGYRVSATAGSASVGVADDDVPVVSIAGGADVGEGGDAVFTVSASPAPWAGLDVSVAVTQTGDFGVSPGSRTVTVPTSGTATLTVATADDSADEADGSVTATVDIGSGYTVSAVAGTAAVDVRDDDPPVSDPVVSITAGSGISEGGDAVFTVSAVPAPSAALTVTVSVSQTGDYGITGGSRQVTIPASGTATLTVATANDSTDEADGSVTANLSTGAGYTVSATAGSASVAVSDDDDAVRVADRCVAVLSGDGSVSGVWAAGCGSSARAGRFARFFSFSLDGPGRVTIDLKSSADTYLYLRRGVGQKSGAAVASDDDGGGSFDSRISRTLGAGGYTIEATTFHASTPGSFTLTVAGIPAQTVVQPDPEVAIAAGGGITEGGDAVFTVSAVPAPSAALDVTVAVVVSGDFGVSPGSHTVTIPTTGSATLTVATAGDSADEADGSVTATVNTGTGYTVSQSAGTASVAVADDDDPAPPPSVCVPSLPSDAVTVSEVTGWRGEYSHAAHQQRWDRVLAALGVDTGEEAMTVADAQAVKAQFDNDRWDRTVRTLVAMAQCDDDPPPAAVPVVSVAAGGGIAEGGDATFTVTADPAPTAALTVDVTVAQTGDFGVATGTRQVTVPTSGTVTLTVATVNDSADEADGSVAVTINGGTGYTVSPTAGTATVAVADDDDPPAPVADPEVSITAGGGVTEGGDATFTVTADPAPTAPLTVDVTVAQVGDFGVSPGSRTVTVPTGGSVTLTVATANDTADEADGSVTATVSAGSGYTISATAGTATVAVADDDDPPVADPEVSITAGGGVTEGGDATFTVTADPAPSAALTVEVTIAQTGDHGVAAGTRQVTIPTSGTVTLTVATVNDSTDEADGTVTATVGSGSGYTVSTASGSATVAVADDDDPPPNATPSLSISDASASEGGTLTFTVTLSPASGRYVWVHYYARPAFGAALSATFADFAQAYGMLTFSPGETTKTITVAAVDDSSPEGDETFRVVLYSASQAAVADGEGIGTITDND